MTRPLEALLRDAVESAVANGDLPPGLGTGCTVEEPAHPAFGDGTCRAAMVLARRTGRPAPELAATVVRHVRDPHGWLERIEAAGPGFINVRASLGFWRDALAATLGDGGDAVVSGRGAGGPGGAALRSPTIAPGGAPRATRSVVATNDTTDALVAERIHIVADALTRLLADAGEGVERAPGPLEDASGSEPSRTIVVSADLRSGAVGRAKALVAAAGGDPQGLRVVPVGTVDVVRRGRRLDGDEAGAALAADGARLALLAVAADTPVTLDAAALEGARIDSPIVAVRYALARIARLVTEDPQPRAVDVALLGEPERECLRAIGTHPDVVLRAARRLEPDRLVAHARAVAAAFHRYYNRGRFQAADPGVRGARAALARGVDRVLRHALAIAGEH